MVKKVYYLSTCSTCNRILKELDPEKVLERQDIKTEKITAIQLDELHRLAGSYESLFSRRSMQYKELGLANKSLTEKDYKRLILEHYSFLKRPVIVLGNNIFIGNSKEVVAAAKQKLDSVLI